MENALVSIIVPVYNVSQYLRRCLNSIINQVYKNLEIILIDDGSIDDSGTICDEFEKKDSRIKVIHQKNGGLSCARNAGINMATGKYIAFVDSDDFVHEEYISYMYEIAMKAGVDIVICNFEKGRMSSFPRDTTYGSYELYSSEQMLKNWHSTLCAMETTSWNKLILRELFIESVFAYPEGVFYEDVRTTHLLINYASKIAVTKRKLYYYYQRKNSITKKLQNEKNIKDNLVAQNIRINFFAEKGYEEAVHRLMIGRQKYYMLMFILNKSKKIQKELLMLFGDSYELLIECKETTWIEKLMFQIFKIFFVHGSLRRRKIK